MDSKRKRQLPSWNISKEVVYSVLYIWTKSFIWEQRTVLTSKMYAHELTLKLWLCMDSGSQHWEQCSIGLLTTCFRYMWSVLSSKNLSASDVCFDTVLGCLFCTDSLLLCDAVTWSYIVTYRGWTSKSNKSHHAS